MDATWQIGRKDKTKKKGNPALAGLLLLLQPIHIMDVGVTLTPWLFNLLN
jgi:hypothetical protein